MHLTQKELKNFLDEKVELYLTPAFIEEDPIQIPKQFSLLQDIEIAAFLTATISWGNRKSILKDAQKMMQFMDNSPFDFVQNHTKNDLENISGGIHRTFQSEDLKFFILQLKRLYSENKSLEKLFQPLANESNCMEGIERCRTVFFNQQEHRSTKHISSPTKVSAAK